MSAFGQFRYLPPDYDPLAPREVATSAVPSMRLIVVLRSDAKSDRYSLHRFGDGAVAWRCDTFTSPEHHAEPARWIGYRGELTVGEVIERFPDHRSAVIEWTRHEIKSGVDRSGLHDAAVAHRRALSLERLASELDAALAPPDEGHRAA
jgi:hypothetical protein